MKKPTAKTRNIIITSTVCSLAVVTGIGLGLFFGDGLFAQVSEKADNDWEMYEDDARSLYKKYEKSKGNIDGFKSYELANIALHLYEENPNHYSVVRGTAVAKSMGVTVEQKVNNYNIRQGDNYFWESLSDSTFANPGGRFYYNSNEEYVNCYFDKKGTKKNTDATIGNWPEIEKTEMTPSEFENKWGRTLDLANIYTISSQTVLSEKPIARDENGNMIIELEMDVTKCNKRYIRQVISMSGPDEDPVFESLNLKFVIDNQLRLISKESNEVYDIKVGMSAHTKSNLVEHFFYDAEMPIPSINENCNYGGK